ncbi:MAG: cadherin domain-containing protein [Chloroflexota bacterium]|nr:cadherin domain-containing protein [Chloroflexota bacterium]
MKTQIAAIEQEVRDGGGSEAYRECIADKYRRERVVQFNLAGRQPYQRYDIAVESGLPTGTHVFEDGSAKYWRVQPANRRSQFWLEENDKDLFVAEWPGVIITLRPLPEGEYKYFYLSRLHEFILCDAYPEELRRSREHFVTVTAPAGTTHELFFDPVAVGTTVKADGTNGVLKPASFTDANGASASIGSIEWQSGTVKLGVTPDDAFAGQTMDIIELDGTVSLSLDVADATVDATNDTLSWSVSSQPWEDGDKLMVRIHKVVPAPQGVTASLSGGTFTISWSAVTGAAEYRVQYRTGGSEEEWTNLDAATGRSQTFSPEGGVACGTTYEFRVQARGDGTTFPAEWSASSESVSHTNSIGKCNRPPVFTSDTYTFTVSEDARVWPAVHSVGTVSATDPDEGDGLLYRITAGNGAGRFNVVSSHHGGQILVWAALDYETVSSYTLTVEARDGKEGGTSSATVEISVTNVDEGGPPAPDDLAVSFTEGTFSISWSAATGADRYLAMHRVGGADGNWTNLDSTTSTSQTFTPEDGVACGTTYEFRVQAHGDGETHIADWGAPSGLVSHTTRACNRAPAFGSATYEFSVSEDASTGTSVGTVSAIDPDEGDSVTYSITDGNDESKFSIGSSGGNIAVAGSLDYETVSSYTLTVEASDGKEGSTSSATVEISVTNVAEGVPSAPEDLAVSLSGDTFSISWSAMTGAGQYRVQHRAGEDADTWTNLDVTTGTSQTFSPDGGPSCGTTYEFRVQARGDGEIHVTDWGAPSESVSHTTGACNRAPVFGSGTYEFSVSEDASTGTSVGTVSATDPDDGDSVTYSITSGNDEGKFFIGSSGGRISVAGSLDYETVSSYTLTVEARDGKEGGTSTATVKISVTDVFERAPPAPINLASSYNSGTGTFGFSWRAVAGADRYRVQYRVGGAEGTWTNLESTTNTSQTFSPEGGPECGTTYEFQVQARGDGETYQANWSSPSGSVTYTTPACN